MKQLLFCALLASSSFLLSSEKISKSSSGSISSPTFKSPKSLGTMLTQDFLQECANSNSQNPLVVALLQHIYSTENKDAIWTLYCKSKKS
ncbi:MAG: hypothetical protein NTU89_02605 [Candidatus Dependentiae bacterium]|nr:hypothetical protein [Candidatus Dependentiae bacterium]